MWGLVFPTEITAKRHKHHFTFSVLEWNREERVMIQFSLATVGFDKSASLFNKWRSLVAEAIKVK